MKNLIETIGITMIFLIVGCVVVSAQSGSTTINVDSDAAAGLDLYAVAELFKESENLEKFEETINNSETGVNNLDLNQNGEVDFIRAVEQVKDYTHLIILQVPLGENDFQDVATIAVERETGDKYNLQIQGDPSIYGDNYYVVPANNNFSLWNVVRWIFRPDYRPYVSVYSYRVLPNWWKIRRPVAVNVYRTRVNVFSGRRHFVATKTVKVKSIAKVNYRPRTSTLVVRKKTVTTTTVKARNNNQTGVVKTTETKIKMQTKKKRKN